MYKTILHATDLSENHFSICEKAVKMAKSMHAKLFFLHVIELPNSLLLAQNLGFAELAAPVTAGAKTVMANLADNFNMPSSHFFVEVGKAYTHILSKVEELGCDLVILGDHKSGSLTNLHASTAHAVINHASCDLLTIRG